MIQRFLVLENGPLLIVRDVNDNTRISRACSCSGSELRATRFPLRDYLGYLISTDMEPEQKSGTRRSCRYTSALPIVNLVTRAAIRSGPIAQIRTDRLFIHSNIQLQPLEPIILKSAHCVDSSRPWTRLWAFWISCLVSHLCLDQRFVCLCCSSCIQRQHVLIELGTASSPSFWN